MNQVATAVKDGPNHTNYPLDMPEGTCVVVDLRGAHLPYYVQAGGTLYSGQLTREPLGGKPEDVIGANPWRVRE